MDDAAPPDAASPRSAWIVVAVLAAGLVAFAYAASSGRSRADEERADLARRLDGGFREPRIAPQSAPPTDVVRPTPVSNRSRVVGKPGALAGHDICGVTLTELLATVRAADTTPSDILITTRSELLDVLGSLPADMPGAEEDIRAAIEKINHALVPKMREEAKTFCAASSTTPSQGLAKYAAAEDCVRKAIEDAKRANNRADDAAYTAIYKGLLDESDAYTQRVVTPEFIASVPWKDLLSGEMAGKWSRTTNVPGFSCRVAGGTVTTSPPDSGGKIQGVIGILDQPTDDLRHFVLDMEFAVEGVVTMYAHSAPPPALPNNYQSVAYDLQTGAGFLMPGAKYTLSASYVGSDFAVNVSGNSEKFTEYRPTPSWAKRRRGGIVFVIPPGARLTITRMRIKELR